MSETGPDDKPQEPAEAAEPSDWERSHTAASLPSWWKPEAAANPPPAAPPPAATPPAPEPGVPPAAPAGQGTPFEHSGTAAALPSWWHQGMPAPAAPPAVAPPAAKPGLSPEAAATVPMAPGPPAPPPPEPPKASSGTETMVMGAMPGTVHRVALVTVEKGPDAGLRFRVVSDHPSYWGRSTDNDMVVSDPGTSRRHARIEYREGGFQLIDLGSVNGTFLNGTRVLEAPLKNGDRVKMGQNEIVVALAT